MIEYGSNNGQNDNNFVAKDLDTKNIVPWLIRLLIRETRKHQLTYDHLNYVFRRVREGAEVKVARRAKKLYELPTQEEIKAFFSVIEDPIHKLMFEFLLSTGVREAELCGLEIEKIDFDKNTAFITGKGNKDRIIIISERLSDRLKLYLNNRPQRYLFQTNRFNKYSTRRIQQLCKLYKEKAQIPKTLSPHTFRHLFNTRLAEAGVNKERRALLAGHSSEATQDIYTHLGIGGIKTEILKVLNDLNL